MRQARRAARRAGVSCGGRKRGKRSEPGGTAPSSTASGRSGSSPGKTAASVVAVKYLVVDALARFGVPATAFSASPPSRTVVSRVARTAASATVRPARRRLRCGAGSA